MNFVSHVPPTFPLRIRRFWLIFCLRGANHQRGHILHCDAYPQRWAQFTMHVVRQTYCLTHIFPGCAKQLSNVEQRRQ